MNWVLMLVLLVLACCAIYGYTKGFLRIVFSLVAWVIVLVFVSWATPHVSQWIQENTTIYEKIEAACEESVRRAAQGKMEEGAGEQYRAAGELGLDLPESVMARFPVGFQPELHVKFCIQKKGHSKSIGTPLFIAHIVLLVLR